MSMSRRNLLSLIGLIGGSATMMQAMAQLGHAATIPYNGPPKLQGSGKKTKVAVIGAGLAGMTAAYELRKAGYEVQVLEYNSRIGGRCWTIRGGDRYTELGGAEQHCQFDPGLYMNPGPWRISHTHRAILDYCQNFGVALEPFLQINFNGYVQSKDMFGGKPQRYGQVIPDFQGYIAEMLSKASQQNLLDQPLGKDDIDLLRGLLSSWGGLNADSRYALGAASSRMRGPDAYDSITGKTVLSQPLGMREVMQLCDKAGLWRGANHIEMSQFQMPLFQAVGGMDMIAKAFAQRLEGVIKTEAKVTAIKQSDKGVKVHYENVADGSKQTLEADWCICTIPFPILSQIEMDVGAGMRNGINAVPHNSEVKIGLQFKRRFWEQDEGIYGGFTITDLPIREIGYPSNDLNHAGKGVLYGAVIHSGPISYEMGGMSPQERIDNALKYGAMIHPQYRDEYENGMAVSWYRNPYSMGCTAKWNDTLIRDHLENIRAFDGRIVLAGEGVSVHGWQNGSIMSAQDVVERLHQRVMNG